MAQQRLKHTTIKPLQMLNSRIDASSSNLQEIDSGTFDEISSISTNIVWRGEHTMTSGTDWPGLEGLEIHPTPPPTPPKKVSFRAPHANFFLNLLGFFVQAPES